MKDFIKEFGDDQQGKKIPVKFEPPSEWAFEPDIKHKPIKSQSPHVDKIDKQITRIRKIKEDELKDMVSEAVLDMMNTMDTPPFSSELLEEHKREIEEKIKSYCHRGGMMSVALKEDVEKDEAIISALIDPTNRNNWMHIKEEVIYKLPSSYKDSLWSYTMEMWNKNKVV